uniref:Uncharacterized protein n=1 Tax=Lobelia fenshamii TaxID=2010899 RepID=A0A1Z2R3A5_9ASTR|nr:hypothetical protein Lo_spn1Pt0565 [Lobelia fenshamii]
MKKPNYSIERQVFFYFWTKKLDFFLARLSLRYLLTWGLETDSWRHKIALTYLLNKGLETRNLFDRLALTYVLTADRQTNSLFARLARAYLVRRGLETYSLFDTMARAFMYLLKRGQQTGNFFDQMALMYLVSRRNEAIHQGLSVRGLEDVCDYAKVEGMNLIDRNLQSISKTPMAWQTAKNAVSCRLLEAFDQDTDAFEYTAELEYWTGALARLHQLEKEENCESE